MLFPGNESWSEAEENRTGALVALGGPGAPDGPGPEAVVVPVLFGLIFALGLVGNCLVLAVVGRARYGSGPGVPRGVSAGQSPTNLFILNLSVADLCFLLVCVPVHATIYSLPQWLFGSFLCTFGHYVFTVCMLVSVFTLSAMSVDRYVAVVLSRRAACVRSRRNALLAVALTWILALVLSVPVAQHQVVTGHPHAPNSTFCWERWYGPSRAAYRVTVVMLGYVLPLLLICVSYSKVLFHLHKKMKNMSKKSERSKKKRPQLQIDDPSANGAAGTGRRAWERRRRV
uniref:G-protein coupled receptors family 1 profile domain-containing protein n=1 Tax=Knipowitschia caucasica TaxID=637954 RepID=A0AAV2LES0_KNICA